VFERSIALVSPQLANVDSHGRARLLRRRIDLVVDLADFLAPPPPIPVRQCQNLRKRPFEVIGNERNLFIELA
jgi:hypothetical protein